MDSDNLDLLSWSLYASWYGDMTMTGGFYTNCTGISWYSPASNEVYGEIIHNLYGINYYLFAGLSYDFTGNSISGTSFDHTLAISTWGIHNGYLFDTNGGIAEISMNLPYCGNFQLSPSVINPWNTITFLCEGNSIYGYKLDIFNASWTMIYYDVVLDTGTSHTRYTGNALPTGNYFAACTILLSWSYTWPQCANQLPFQVGTGTTPSSGTWCNPNFQAEITFASYNGSVVTNPSLGTYYTNTTGIVLQRAATEPTNFAISGDFTDSVFTGIYTGTNIFNHLGMVNITLLNTNTRNNFSSTYTTGTCSYIDAAKRVYVDTLPPLAPVITAPSTGTANICPSVPLSVTWTTSLDSWSQLSHYRYEIYNNSGMVTWLVLSWTTTTPSTTLNVSLLPLGTYYLRVLAVDNVGLSSMSNIVTLNSSAQYCTAGTWIVIVTPTIRLRNVDLDTVYRSDPIWILGLTGPTLVSIDKGMLFINNTTGSNGTTGLVTSHDTLYIELISSDEYDTTVTSTLTIAGLTGTFSLTTKANDCHLSTTEKLIIQNIYTNLKTQYNGNMAKFSEFLNTFMNMVEDEAEISRSCTLDYLLELIQNEFDVGIDTSKHITPNCKEYSIGYDTNQMAYYSPDMMNRYYFINRESLIRHLDYYNPGDCHLNTYGDNIWSTENLDTMTHVAPNGKIYHLIWQYGWYSATEFLSPKYFDSLEGIKNYINLKNPPQEIWNHTIDRSFIPIIYAAPNGKEYKIYKTNRWFMSYKLMKVRYYSTLSELKSYIDKNNPSKR